MSQLIDNGGYKMDGGYKVDPFHHPGNGMGHAGNGMGFVPRERDTIRKETHVNGQKYAGPPKLEIGVKRRGTESLPL